MAEALGRKPAWAEVAAAMQSGFRDAFELQWRPAALSKAEAERARALKRERFGNRDWTYKR